LAEFRLLRPAPFEVIFPATIVGGKRRESSVPDVIFDALRPVNPIPFALMLDAETLPPIVTVP
jgi:hypothetical protein